LNAELIRGAFFWGLISAVSLPLGALTGLLVKPSRRVTSALMAFGAGALLFALTIELFSETLHYGTEQGNEIVYAMIIGALIGGGFFDLCNRVLNNNGAYLGSWAKTRKYLRRMKRSMVRRLIGELSRVRLLQSLPPAAIAKLIPHIERQTFKAGETIFQEGEVGSTLYFIISGEVGITRHDLNGTKRTVALLGQNDTFGEMALLSHQPRNATARALEDIEVLKVLHEDFDMLLSQSEELRETVKKLFDRRAEELSEKISDYRAEKWKKEAMGHLQKMQISVTQQEIDEAGRKAMGKGGAAFAIWLGILLDSIPESMIIGMLSASVTGMSMAFISGVFLANLPESMSSAVVMRKGGMRIRKILWMWSSLCIITGIGAVIGVMLFPTRPRGAVFLWIAGIEGMAAGAMLTMIAETMLPEAFEQGGAIVGFSTLMGFLTALIVKLV
jgi:CRP-like cAMP-binding protein